MQIVIPMSGFGERFRAKGFTKPKPLIGKPETLNTEPEPWTLNPEP